MIKQSLKPIQELFNVDFLKTNFALAKYLLEAIHISPADANPNNTYVGNRKSISKNDMCFFDYPFIKIVPTGGIFINGYSHNEVKAAIQQFKEQKPDIVSYFDKMREPTPLSEVFEHFTPKVGNVVINENNQYYYRHANVSCLIPEGTNRYNVGNVISNLMKKAELIQQLKELGFGKKFIVCLEKGSNEDFYTNPNLKWLIRCGFVPNIDNLPNAFTDINFISENANSIRKGLLVCDQVIERLKHIDPICLDHILFKANSLGLNITVRNDSNKYSLDSNENFVYWWQNPIAEIDRIEALVKKQLQEVQIPYMGLLKICSTKGATLEASRIKNKISISFNSAEPGRTLANLRVSIAVASADFSKVFWQAVDRGALTSVMQELLQESKQNPHARLILTERVSGKSTGLNSKTVVIEDLYKFGKVSFSSQDFGAVKYAKFLMHERQSYANLQAENAKLSA